MYHKYFAWIDEQGRWCGQKLVSLGAVQGLRRAVAGLQHFASVQTYDEYAKTLFTPLYADLDHKDPGQALEDARYITHLVRRMAGVKPLVYFSGSKGFHIVIPHRLEGADGHFISRCFFDYLATSLPSLDRAVYRGRAMLRMPSSPASKAGFFKVQLTNDELMRLSLDEIKAMAAVPRVGAIDEYDESKLTGEFFEFIDEARKRIPAPSQRPAGGYDTQLDDMTFCVESMLVNEAPSGERNQTVQLIARFLKRVGLTQDDAARFILAYPHWREYEDQDRGVVKVVGSIYRSAREPVMGCRGVSRDAELMQSRCHPLCWFNRRRLEIVFAGTADPKAGGLQPSVSARTTPTQSAGRGVHAQPEPTVAMETAV